MLFRPELEKYREAIDGFFPACLPGRSWKRSLVAGKKVCVSLRMSSEHRERVANKKTK